MPLSGPTTEPTAKDPPRTISPPKLPRRRQSLAWLPIPTLLLVMVFLYVADLPGVYSFPYGLMVSNFVFLTLCSALIAYLSAQTFLVRGTPALLALGGGVVVWGASAAAAAWSASEPNRMITIHNTGAMLAAACHMLGAILCLRPGRPMRWSTPALLLTYGTALSAVAIVTAFAWEGLLPRFFIQGQGGTSLRQAVLAGSVVMFSVSGVLLHRCGRRTSSPFLYWYSLALGLLATGLLGVMGQSRADSVLNWTSRAAQYLGGVYMLIAAIVAVRESHALKKPLELALEETEERLKALVAATFEGIAVTESGRITDVNEQLVAMLGYTRAELLGMNVADLVAPEDRQRVLANFREERHSRIEHGVLCKGGRQIVVEAHGRTVRYQGLPVRFTAIRDITERKRIEEKLKNSERLYRAIGESIDYGVWVCAPDGRNTYASESFLKLVGITQQQCSDFGWGDVLHPDDSERTIAAWKECVRTGGKWDIEHRFKGVDGNWHHILARGVPVRDERGAITCWAGINLDITSLKQTRAELEEAKRTLDALMEYVPEGITIADAPDGKIRMVSRYGQELLGGPHAGLTVDAVASEWKVFRPDGVTEMSNPELPLTRALEKGEVLRDVELVQVNARGQKLSLACDAAPIRDRAGVIIGSIASWRDITQRKQMETALRQSEERYRALFDNMSEGFAVHQIICDPHGVPWDYRFLAINAAFERLTGLKREQVEGKTVREVLPADASEWVSLYGHVALTGQPLRLEKYSPSLKRHYEIFAYRSAPEQFAVVFMDVTERKQAESDLRQAQQKLQEHAEDLERTVARRSAKLHETISELEHFSYAIAHDMRAPLRAMQSFAEMIQEDAPDEDPALKKEYLRRIKVAAGRMDQLITDSLNYSKAARGEMTVEAVELTPLLQGLLDTYPNLQVDKADIEIARHLPSVLGNEAALTQCFSNLLGNAVKFAKPGTKPHIRIWAEDVQPPTAGGMAENNTGRQSHKVRIWVEDDGIGIPAEAQERIFGIFQRASTTHEGTGIGLAIVRKVAQRMGGEVGVQSELGKGSRFWVVLPKAP